MARLMAISDAVFKIDEKRLSAALSLLGSELCNLDEKETNDLLIAGYIPKGIADWHIAMIKARLVKANG
jgi:hypothetical protein